MSSTYITGQKRIGKTSLAQAVLRYATALAKAPTTYFTFYLEWGEYCAADAAGTVKALGEQIYAFMRSHLPSSIETSPPLFDGSLAPLNLIAKLLEVNCPDKRFVIVLDEFDEIHPEMYRFGPLAEAFFANLRTLSARKNIAFILVGGEKMPFIIGAQGDQLNKFVREPLDYFSRSDEWNDYVSLVVDPCKDSLNWEESALNELFSLTNGEVPPLNSAKGNLVKSVFEKENGLEEAVFRRADHRIFEAGGSWRAGEGIVSSAWIQ